jgi:hypothetical protein
MNINDLKVNDKITTRYECSLSCQRRIFFSTKETGATSVSFISNDYIVLSERTDSSYLLLNAEKIESTIT